MGEAKGEGTGEGKGAGTGEGQGEGKGGTFRVVCRRSGAHWLPYTCLP